MKIPLLEGSSHSLTVYRSGEKTEKSNGLFGDVLNLKMQGSQAEPQTAISAEELSVPLNLLTRALDILEELKEISGPGMDGDRQEFIQETIDLLDALGDFEGEAVLAPALEDFVSTAEQFIVADAVDDDELDVVLKQLMASLDQYESDKQIDSYEFRTISFPGSGQITRMNIAGYSGLPLDKPAHHTIKNGIGQLNSQADNMEAEEGRPISIRLEIAAAKDGPSGTTSVMGGTEKRGPESVNIQSNPDTKFAQVSNMNRNESEEVIVRLAETAPNERRGRELIRQFTNILQKSHFSQGIQTKSLTIRLYPEHLGSLRIELMQKDGIMIARILASTSMAKDMLDSQIHQLRQTFVQQNIQVDKVDILHQEGLDKYTSNDQRGKDQERPGSDERADKDAFIGENDEEDFSDFLQKVLFEMEV